MQAPRSGRPVRLREVIGFLDETLLISKFRDYGVNGLQVEGSPEVDRVVTGVSANMDLLQKAAEVGADLVVVHHGLVWGGGIDRVTGALARRLGFLLEHRISLAGYHLPLDAHARLGNNVGLADAIGLGPERGAFGDVKGHALGLSGAWREPLTRDEAVGRIAATVLGGAAPRFVFPFGPDSVRMVGLCTGAGVGSAAGRRRRRLRPVPDRRAGRARRGSGARARDHPGRRRSLRDGGVRPPPPVRRAYDALPRARRPLRPVPSPL